MDKFNWTGNVLSIGSYPSGFALSMNYDLTHWGMALEVDCWIIGDVGYDHIEVGCLLLCISCELDIPMQWLAQLRGKTDNRIAEAQAARDELIAIEEEKHGAPQEPRTLKVVLDDLRHTMDTLERILDILEASMNSLFWKIRLLLFLAVVGFGILVLVVLGQR